MQNSNAQTLDEAELNRHLDKAFDDEFKSIRKNTELKWLPWIGKNYSENVGKRLLIIGESHYKYISDDSEETPDVIAGYLAGEFTRWSTYNNVFKNDSKQRFVRNIERTLLWDGKPEQKKREEIWETIARYNFIQRTLESLQDRPHDSDWQQGWNTFFQVIRCVKPNYIIFCGVTASKSMFSKCFNNAPSTNKFNSDGDIKQSQKFGKKLIEATIRDEEGIPIPIIFIQHPSSHFSWSSWAGILRLQWPDLFSSPPFDEDNFKHKIVLLDKLKVQLQNRAKVVGLIPREDQCEPWGTNLIGSNLDFDESCLYFDSPSSIYKSSIVMGFDQLFAKFYIGVWMGNSSQMKKYAELKKSMSSSSELSNAIGKRDRSENWNSNWAYLHYFEDDTKNNDLKNWVTDNSVWKGIENGETAQRLFSMVKIIQDILHQEAEKLGIQL